MGIQGLLPLLKKASTKSHVRKFSGCTVAIDAYCWLHKGAFGCAEKLGKGEPTDAYISYCMKYIQVLLDNNIKPILVLDGRNLPSKEHTEKKRRQKRDENKKLAKKHLQEGNRKEAWECFTRCVDITPAMAREFIKVLRSKKIDYVVAPYEADAQLAYLAKTGVADIIITEDSDLILFGCPKIFFKMSVYGDGTLFDQSKLPRCMDVTPKNFVFERFRWMCILSGCDYLPSLPGIGLVRAKKIIQAGKFSDIREMIQSIPLVLEKVPVEVTDEYIDGFIQAENTFLYQLVFDPKTRQVIPLNHYPENTGENDFPYAGSYLQLKIAVGLALGNVDLHSLKFVDSFEPLNSGYNNSSIWSSSFVPTNGRVVDESKDIGMQILSGSGQSKKRPLATTITNRNSVDTVLGDEDLWNMYTDSSTTSLISSDLDSDELESDETETESPSSFKRRRVIDRKTEPDEREESSPSCNTRSKISLPFRKSSENLKVVVKSKYFRSEEKPINGFRLTEKQKMTESQRSDEMGDLEKAAKQKLSIYSSESQYDEEMNGDDMMISQRPSSNPLPLASQCSQLSNGVMTRSSTLNGKTNPEEVTLSDDDSDNDEKDESFSDSKVQRKPGLTFSKSEGQSPYFFSSTNNSKRAPSSQPSSKCRRPGLSRSTKKDSKQQSVMEMFARQKSKQC